MGSASSRAAPQLSVNALDADIPITPPLLALTLFFVSFLLSKTVTRYRFLPDEVASLKARAAIFAVGIAASLRVQMMVSDELVAAGSGINFAPVAGLATSGPFESTRNPLYVCFVFVTLPMIGLLFDSAWLIFSAGAVFVYISTVVIPKEEEFLLAQFGSSYEAYMATTPRWLLD